MLLLTKHFHSHAINQSPEHMFIVMHIESDCEGQGEALPPLTSPSRVAMWSLANHHMSSPWLQ